MFIVNIEMKGIIKTQVELNDFSIFVTKLKLWITRNLLSETRK